MGGLSGPGGSRAVLRPLRRLPIAFLAILFLLTIVTVIRGHVTSVQAVGVNVTPSSAPLNTPVKLDGTCGSAGQFLTFQPNTAGSFVFAGSAGAPNQPINMAVNASTQASCVAPGAFTVYFICNTSTQVLFTLASSGA